MLWGASIEVRYSVEELAKKKGITMGQVAIAWSLSKEGVTAPIVGTTRLKNLQEALGACLPTSYV